MSDAATSRASSMSRLEDRIRRLEDVHQIQQLGVLYMLVMDEHDEEGIRRVFTEDAVVEVLVAEPRGLLSEGHLNLLHLTSLDLGRVIRQCWR